MKIIKKIIYFSFLTFLLFSFFTINSYALDEYSDNTQNNKIENGFYYTDRKTIGDIENIILLKK